MLTTETARKVLAQDSSVHHFGDEASFVLRPEISHRAMKVVIQEPEFVRVWSEEKGAYEYIPVAVVNTEAESRFFAAKAARTSGDFDSLLEATKGGTILPFDYFVDKLTK